MKFIVKNTTINSPLDLLCPHSCRGCGALGAVLCECCKNYNIQQQIAICPYCKRTFPRNKSSLEICSECESPFSGFWAIGWREGVLARLVSEFKYQSVRVCGDTLAELLDAALPPAEAFQEPPIIVPLPTIGKHIRARGLDHTSLLARKLAKRRGWKVKKLLGRATDSVQVGTDASTRRKQAATTYEVTHPLDPQQAYLLLDDVWTTGASMESAAMALQRAGARRIYGAVVEIGKDAKIAPDESDAISE